MAEHQPIEHNGLTVSQKLKNWARNLKNEVIALYFALKHPDTPIYAKIFIAIVVGYALSPIDLVPDFIPVLGYIDEVILLPLCIALALKIMPEDIMNACREKARSQPLPIRPKIWLAAYIIIALWLCLIYRMYRWLQ